MRKMSLIFTGLLAILFITGQASAQADVAFTVVDTIISWGSAFYSMEDSITDDTAGDVEQTLQRVYKISSKLENLQTHIPAKLDIMLNTLLNDIETTTELQNLKSELLPHLHRMEHYFHDSLKYSPYKFYTNSTLEQFTERVLYGTDNLHSTLTAIRDIFIPGTYVNLNAGYVPLFRQKTTQNLPTDCQRYSSPQQLMFYIYIQLMIVEMKALATLKNAYETESWLENYAYSYRTELNDAKTDFVSGVRMYYSTFKEQLSLLPRHLHRCHVESPIRNVHYLELEGLSRIKFLVPSFSKNPHCYSCPVHGEIDNMSRSTGTHIYNCDRTSHSVTVCPAESGSPRDYLWWRNEDGTYYGGDKACPRPTKTVTGERGIKPGLVSSGIPYSCNLCYCSVDKIVQSQSNKNSWRISSKIQISDIWNNMVVTGVQFIRKGKTIHLRIQQGKAATNGMIYDNIEWKDIDTDFHYNGSLTLDNHFFDERVGSNEKIIYLDDITVPKGSVITGVQIARSRGQANFRLWIHATEFDFATGKLNPYKNSWCSHAICRKEASTTDYERERVEIDMGRAGDPTKGAEFHYDAETNKKITFKHTDLYKDGGQTTVPFFDAQPLHTQPAFPLTGMGLYYRGSEGFGGYIAPRIFTFNVTRAMVSPIANSHE